MADNTSYMKEFKPLSEKEQELLREAARITDESIAIPCTACRYCVDGCPEHIAIPDLFALYNKQYRFGAFPSHKSSYKSLTDREKGHGSPEDCIGCRQCEGQCPQHIGIVDWLKKVGAEFTKS